jgi:hypothetical protein
MRQTLSYYRDKLTALRNALDVLLGEMDRETAPAPRKRRNLKEERLRQLEMETMGGTWRKPTELKKKKVPEK